MPVHAVEPRCYPTDARFKKGDADLRMVLADAAPDHAHAGQHHFHRMGNDVAGGAGPLKPAPTPTPPRSTPLQGTRSRNRDPLPPPRTVRNPGDGSSCCYRDWVG